MRTGTCENCGATVKVITAFLDFGGKDKHKSGPAKLIEALPGQKARPGLPVHLKGCPECGAPRADAPLTMEAPPVSPGTING